MSDAIVDEFLIKLVSYCRKYSLQKISLVLHGGEPLLYGKQKMAEICSKIRAVEHAAELKVDIALTSNGALVDEEWAGLFRRFGVSPCVSIDGPPKFHDSRRVDLHGKATHARVAQGIKVLKENGFHDLSLLAVADTCSDPLETYDHFVNDLGVRFFDILSRPLGSDHFGAFGIVGLLWPAR
jgi:uncharacterized protein